MNKQTAFAAIEGILQACDEVTRSEVAAKFNLNKNIKRKIKEPLVSLFQAREDLIMNHFKHK